MTLKKKLILASSSPRRLQLLQALGFEVQAIAPDVDETPFKDELPIQTVQRLAKLKAEAISAQNPIIAADTLVFIDEKVLGKPEDEAEAIKVLKLLSGRTHQVVTGYAVKQGERTDIGFAITEVSFRDLPMEQIVAYVETGEPLDKAGAYGIQGKGAGLIDHVNGSYTNVIGLPIKEILAALADFHSYLQK